MLNLNYGFKTVILLTLFLVNIMNMIMPGKVMININIIPKYLRLRLVQGIDQLTLMKEVSLNLLSDED